MLLLRDKVTLADGQVQNAGEELIATGFDNVVVVVSVVVSEVRVKIKANGIAMAAQITIAMPTAITTISTFIKTLLLALKE